MSSCDGYDQNMNPKRGWCAFDLLQETCNPPW